MATDILLEAGTNELELLVFRLGETAYGINVAKVREVVQRSKIINIPKSPEAVAGSFQLRDRVLTLVDLSVHLKCDTKNENEDDGLVIILEFSNMICGALVDHVEQIHRMSWDKIMSPPGYLTDLEVPITGVTLLDERIVLIVDFETIMGDVLGIKIADSNQVDTPKAEGRGGVRILIAEDSPTIRNSLRQILTEGGFDNLTICADGLAAWNKIQAGTEGERLPFDVVITDIEMPQLDGLHLTKKIKSDPRLNGMPVVLFSSLITPENAVKGRQVGADAQISKPDSTQVIASIENCLIEMGVMTPIAAATVDAA